MRKPANRNPDITKLPVWAQTYIDRITMERDDALKRMRLLVDDQTPTEIFYDEMLDANPADGGSRIHRHYVQSYKVTMESSGVVVNLLADKTAGNIRMSWGQGEDRMGDVMFQPSGYQSALLFLPKPPRR